MTQARVKFPAECEGMTAPDGTAYVPDDKGECVIASEHVAELASFGIEVLEYIADDEQPPADPTDEEKRLQELAEIAKGTQAQIAAQLDALSLEDLQALQQIEHENSARKGVLADIEEAIKAKSKE